MSSSGPCPNDPVFNRRLAMTKLIEELADESSFENVEDLWLSMGYNISDPNAAWLEEDPEGTAIISKGNQMIKELQTTREEPPKELLEYGPEGAPPMNVPEVLIDPQDDASTLGCSEKDVAYILDLPGHGVSLEQGIAACQMRCARAPGCAHFSYWPPQRHCRLHGILAEPLPGQPLWISGPPGCKESQVSNATRRTVARKLTCYHPHAVYEPRDTLAEPQLTYSIEDCQRRCQQTKGCAHFVYSELDGECSLADVTAVKGQPGGRLRSFWCGPRALGRTRGLASHLPRHRANRAHHAKRTHYRMSGWMQQPWCSW